MSLGFKPLENSAPTATEPSQPFLLYTQVPIHHNILVFFFFTLTFSGTLFCSRSFNRISPQKILIVFIKDSILLLAQIYLLASYMTVAILLQMADNQHPTDICKDEFISFLHCMEAYSHSKVNREEFISRYSHLFNQVVVAGKFTFFTIFFARLAFKNI